MKPSRTALSYAVVRKIISGGQTGADRAGLDFAIEVGLAHGGYVPKARKAEDGRIDEKYRLVELSSSSYPERTKRNVRESDGTVILSLNEKLSGGSALTLSYAQHARKPVLHLHNSETGRDPLPRQVRQLKEFIESKAIQVPNVAGPRESNEPGVYRFTLEILRRVLAGPERSFIAFRSRFQQGNFRPPEIIRSIACK